MPDEEDDPEIQELKERVGALLRANDEPPAIVYHYTSLDTATKILNSYEMWCANVAYANDPTEGVHGQQVIARVLRNDPDLQLRGAQRLIAEDIDGYAISFSAEPDVLTQWRSYCSDGRGVAIGIDTNVLRQRTNVAFSHVEYDTGRQERLVRDVLDIFRRPILSARFQPARLQNLVGTLALSFVMLRAMLKHPSYFSEREYRLLDALPKDPANHDTNLQTFARGNRDVPYFIVDLRASRAENAVQPIREVWIGPCLDTQAVTTALENTVAYRSRAFPIRTSTVPMRCD